MNPSYLNTCRLSAAKRRLADALKAAGVSSPLNRTIFAQRHGIAYDTLMDAVYGPAPCGPRVAARLAAALGLPDAWAADISAGRWPEV